MACNGANGWPHGSLFSSLLGIAKPPSTPPVSANATAVPFNLRALSLFVPVYPETWSQSFSIYPSITQDEGLSQTLNLWPILASSSNLRKVRSLAFPMPEIFTSSLFPWTRWRIEKIRLPRSVPSLPPASRTPVRFLSAQNPYG